MKLLLPVSMGLPQLWLEDSKCSLVKVSSSVASEENQIRVKTTSPGLTLRHSPVCTDTELGRYLANWVQFVFTFSRATLVWSMSSSLRMFSTTMVMMATPSTCTVYSTVQYSTVQYSTVQYSTVPPPPAPASRRAAPACAGHGGTCSPARSWPACSPVYIFR